jgi:uroporphyrinogen decarboxylase
MNGRERVLLTLDHKEPDRAPIDFGGRHTTMHVRAHQALKRHLNIKGGEEVFRQFWLQTVEVDPRLNQILGGDVAAFCTHPPDTWEMDLDPDTNTFQDEWGASYRMSEGSYYYDYHAHPLSHVTSISELDQYAWPDPHDPGRYRGLKESVESAFKQGNKAIMVTIAPAGSWEHTWTLRGPEQALMDLVVNRRLYEEILDRTVEFQCAQWEQVLKLVGPWVDIAAMSDDLGTQAAPLMSPDLYRQLFKPRLMRITSLIQKHSNAKIYIHSDGAIREFLPTLIEAGIQVINPVQTECPGMEPEALKRDFGKDLIFWGAGCNTSTLAFGTPEEVSSQAKTAIRHLAPGGGYVFGPIHNIQAQVPPENIVALFDVANEFGGYPIDIPETLSS